ncbi:MAG: GNAT family N-acetyltransferase [Candidatus Helarchaeota archaeon]
MSKRRHIDLELDIMHLPLVEFIKIKGLQIRHFNRKTDAVALLNIFNAIWKESGGPPISLTEEQAKQLPEDKVIVAEFEGKIVGFVMFDVIEEEQEKKGIFRFIGVLKEYRGRKIASAIAFRAGEDLLKYGIRKVKSFIPETNQKAIDFIQFFGFEKRKAVDYAPQFPS